MSDQSAQTLAVPASQSERILILDSLRGIAILGILLMNIPGFGLPHSAIVDYTINDQSKLNYLLWYVFGPGVFEGSQRAIFSMLFGAGTLIFIGRLEKRLSGLLPVEYFFRRQLWLLLFGLFNAYVLLWFWDILFHYAICGLFLFPFRRLKPKYLLAAAGVALILMTARENLDLYRQKSQIARAEKIATLDTTKVKLTDSQKADLAAMNQMKEKSTPQAKEKTKQEELRVGTGGYADFYRARSEMAVRGETKGMFYFLLWDVLLFMFIGMAFFKLGVLQGQAKTRVYAWMAILGIGIGLPVSYLFVINDVNHNFNWFEITKRKKFEFYELQRLIHSIGIFGLIMLMYKSGWFKWLFALMRPVGQMAFTNYLAQSFLCGLFFYGVGFGFFGRLQIYQLYYVVAAVWIIEIVWSHLWLRQFRFGPLEWLWRSLTYWRKQPMKKEKAVQQIAEPVVVSK